MRLPLFLSPVNADWRLTAKLKQTPALVAFLVQVFSLICVWIITQTVIMLGLLVQSHTFAIHLGFLVLLQGVLASSLSHKLGMANWWTAIHLGFPIALWVMAFVEVSATFYLAGFMVFLSLYWTSFKTQVPFYPSRPAVWRAVDSVVHEHFNRRHQPLNIVEIGSGLGDFSMYLEKRNHLYQVLGIEIAPLPWLISRVRALLTQSQVQFRLGNYQQMDFAQNDVIFAYLSPAAMPALWLKAKQEMRSNSLLISLEFDIPGVQPTHVIYPSKNSPCLYIFKM